MMNPKIKSVLENVFVVCRTILAVLGVLLLWVTIKARHELVQGNYHDGIPAGFMSGAVAFAWIVLIATAVSGIAIAVEKFTNGRKRA